MTYVGLTRAIHPPHTLFISLSPPHSAGPLSLTYLMICKPEIIFMFYMCLITFVLVLFIYFIGNRCARQM